MFVGVCVYIIYTCVCLCSVVCVYVFVLCLCAAYKELAFKSGNDTKAQ